MDKQRWLALPALLLAMAASLDCGAAQRKDARDGAVIDAQISEHGITRIRIEGAMITGLVGKIQSATACTPAAEIAAPTTPNLPAPSLAVPTPNPTGEVTITCDMSKGEIYVTPVGTGKKPISLFVSSDHATYTLALSRANIPDDTIVLVDPSVRTLAEHRDVTRERQAGHVKRIKTMLRAMVASHTPSDIQMEEVNVDRPLWREASLTLTRTYRGRGLVGERYLLTNISSTPLTVSEQEFDREGAGVLAIAIDNLNLRAGENTWVYVIRSEGQP